MEQPQNQSVILLLMLSIKKCNEVLNKKEQKYTMNQIKAIREHLYQLSEIIHQTKLLKNEKGTAR